MLEKVDIDIMLRNMVFVRVDMQMLTVLVRLQNHVSPHQTIIT